MEETLYHLYSTYLFIPSLVPAAIKSAGNAVCVPGSYVDHKHGPSLPYTHIPMFEDWATHRGYSSDRHSNE